MNGDECGAGFGVVYGHGRQFLPSVRTLDISFEKWNICA